MARPVGKIRGGQMLCAGWGDGGWVAYRACDTTFVPILISLACGVVGGQYFTVADSANLRFKELAGSQRNRLYPRR